MFNFENCTIVVQGPVYKDWTSNFLKEYKNCFKNVIFSTWENEDLSKIDCECIINNKPSPGPGNCNLQIKSSLEGCKATKTEFIIKVRSDILIKQFDRWLSFFSEQWSSNKIFVLGLSNKYPFSARDQIFASKTEDMKTLFNIPYLQGAYTPSPSISGMYPEYWITLHYYAQFSAKVRIFLNNPETYLYGNAPLKQHVFDEWNKIGTTYMYPISRNLNYYWPKRFGEGSYNYEETSIAYGEFWHEDLQ